MHEVTYELLHEFLNYDEHTGLLYWKARDAKYFVSPKYATSWNSKHAGKIAGSKFKYPNSPNEYIRVRIFKQNFRAHRLIWWMMTGSQPDFIDHENHNGLDNRWVNLKDVSQQENQKNMTLYKTNTSGKAGVRKHKNGWVATIGKGTYLGYSKTFEGAVEIREKAEIEYEFHKNHGKLTC